MATRITLTCTPAELTALQSALEFYKIALDRHATYNTGMPGVYVLGMDVRERQRIIDKLLAEWKA